MFKSAEQLREEFDQVARRLAQGQQDEDPEQMPETYKANAIKKYLSDQLPAGGKLALEIGSGTGSFTSRLAKRFDHVIALDLSPEMTRLAQKNTGSFTNIEFIIADVNTWEFPKEQFDCVVSITTLHHMPLEPVLMKMKDALRPGGILLIGDFHETKGIKRSIKRKITRIIKGVWRMLNINSHPKTVSRPRIGHDPNEPYLRMNEVYRICKSLLQGARVVKFPRHYAIVWIKP